ncbi:MAG: hypothetical protein ACRDA7_00205 [Metamycoplasmataceae bacterium]
MLKRIITYKPGEHPTPMLAYYTDKNEVFFSEEKELIYGSYTNDYDHYWNIGAYIIIDKENKTIIAYAIANFPNLIYLLRTIHLELSFKFDSQFLDLYQKNLNNLRNEFVIE